MEGTIIVEATADADDLLRRLRAVLAHTAVEPQHVLIVCDGADSDAAASTLSSEFSGIPLQALPESLPDTHLSLLLEWVTTEGAAFLSAGAVFTPPQWRALAKRERSLMPWVPETPLSGFTAEQFPSNGRSWLVSRSVLAGLSGLGAFAGWNLWRIAESAADAGVKLNWPSAAAVASTDAPPPATAAPPALDRESSVLALIPHYRCEEWLPQCLESLLSQSRAPDGIVVIDDCSDVPPTGIVGDFPGVTLLSSAENVGPYRLIQGVIDQTLYDAYLFQDADDWSAYDRLGVLLAEAERTGAELIGSQEFRLLCDDGAVSPVYYPLDVNHAYSKFEAHPILHPATLVSRSLVRRVGGFASALRFGADSEFLRRAAYAGRIVNAPRYCYYHRHRDGSLTTAPETGLGSDARNTLMRDLMRWAEKNKDLMARGELRPDGLSPFAVAEPVPLRRLAGPALRSPAGLGGGPDYQTN